MNVLVNRVLKGFPKNFPKDEKTRKYTQVPDEAELSLLMIQPALQDSMRPWGRWYRGQELF